MVSESKIIDVPTIRLLKVGIIGGGPAGLMTAKMLARDGHSVTVFEARSGNAYGANMIFDVPSDKYFKNILGMDMEGFVPFHSMKFYGPSGRAKGHGGELKHVDREGWQILRSVLIDRLMPDENCPYTILNDTKAKVLKNEPNQKVILEVASEKQETRIEEFDFCVCADGGNSKTRKTVFDDAVECTQESGYYEIHGITRCPKGLGVCSDEMNFYLAPQQGESYPMIFTMTPTTYNNPESTALATEDSELVAWFAYFHTNVDLKTELQSDPIKMLEWVQHAIEEHFTGEELLLTSKILMQPIGDLLPKNERSSDVDDFFGTTWAYMSRIWSMQESMLNLIKNNVYLVGDAAHKFLPHAGGNLGLVLEMLNDFHSQLNARLALEANEDGKSNAFSLQDIIDQKSMLKNLENVVQRKDIGNARLKSQNRDLCAVAP